MAVTVISFADVILSWLLFDSNYHSDRHLVVPSSLTIAKNNGVAPSLINRRQDGTVDSNACMTTQNIWTLPNGRVQFDCPLFFDGLSIRNGEVNSDASTSSSISIWDPKLLGRYDNQLW